MSDHDVPAPPIVDGRPSSYGDQVYGRILQAILHGVYPPGARLPGENELGERLGVSRPVVREALARLRVDGLIEARRGSGTYVLNRPSHALPELTDLTAVPRFLRYQELRLAVEGAAAELAAERRSEKALAEIERAHEQFLAEVARSNFLPESDRRFHLAVSSATGNEFFALALEREDVALSDFMRVSLLLTKGGSSERARKVMAEHAEILEAIRKKDPVWARIAMQSHILQARRRMMDGTLDP